MLGVVKILSSLNQQQEEYDLLLAARRERVKYFYDNDMVCKISKSAQDKLKDADI
jgi:hypothetical protein